MKNIESLQARRFRAIVARYLGLQSKSSEAIVRQTLQNQGPGFIDWYDNRIEALVENQCSPKRRVGTGMQMLELVGPIKEAE